MCSCSIGLAVLLVVEEHLVANGSVEEQSERFSGRSPFDSSFDSERLDWPSPPDGGNGHARDMGPTFEHVIEPQGGILRQTISSSLDRCVCVNLD